ncbi:MAG: outer membrane beta-barrel protein [Rudaea sp.]|uniref:outer membrane protein n=1 Tax=Rudaea sp. TaxID=2136325 RepID=UPI0039E5F43F
MKNTLLVLALVSVGAAVAPCAFADDTSPAPNAGITNNAGGFFVNGDAGASILDHGMYKDNRFAGGINAGYRFALSPYVALGVEGGYTDLGRFGLKDSVPAGLPHATASDRGWTLGANAHLNFNPQWYLSLRGGAYRADMKGWTADGSSVLGTPDNAITAESGYRVNNHDVGGYAGVGVGHDFNDHVSVGLNYTYFETRKDGLELNPGLASVNAEYRF